ncbi:hypothetical protein KIPE111705_12745 [Kibdelosporangium persicum]|uniref:Lipoprotein n=1 Tax=Kibdelosporangium persicum TaxID=2698649 RepID=A0ABX2F9K6_9PSEU|nr:hypothetical protein [Kibdelosporangium persicum]NRN68046.1 hypothetical protein [Kibdelosporangium persicum]
MRGELLGLTLILAVVGCAAHDDRPLDPAVRAAALSLVDEPDRVLVRAEYRAIAECMAGHGMRYPPAETMQADVPVSDGYGGRLAAVPDPSTDSDLVQRAYLDGLPQNERSRYWNTLRPENSPMSSVVLPDGKQVSLAVDGCEAAGRAAVYGSVPDYLGTMTFPAAVAAAAGDVTNTPAVRTALAGYGGCMSAAGYQVGSPREALALARQRFGTRENAAPAGEDERVMAATDHGCQRQNRIPQVLRSTMVDQAAGWIMSVERDVLRLAEIQRRAVRRASAMVGP